MKPRRKLKKRKITIRGEASGQGVAGHQGFKKSNLVVAVKSDSKCHSHNNNKRANI